MVFAAIMVVLLAHGQASRFTITTTVDEEDLDHQYRDAQEKCRHQIQQQYPQMRHCQQYLSSSGGPFEMDMKIQPYGEEDQQQHLGPCCMALRNMEERCRCEFTREALRKEVEQQGPGQGQGPKIEQMKMKAKYLPRQCNIGPRQCRV